MRFIHLVAVGIVATVSALITLPAAVSAQEPAIIRIAVVDLRKINEEAASYLAIRQQVEMHMNQLQEMRVKAEEDLKAANQELNRQRAILSSEVFAEKRSEFERQLISAQHQLQSRKRALDQARLVAAQEVQKVLLAIINDLATQNKLTMILRSDQLLYSAEAMDITKLVMERLNAKLPNVTVKLEAK